MGESITQSAHVICILCDREELIPQLTPKIHEKKKSTHKNDNKLIPQKA